MKVVYILILLVLAASMLGCVGKQPETKAPVTTPTPLPTPISEDLFGTESDLTAIDAMLNDSAMDISLTEI